MTLEDAIDLAAALTKRDEPDPHAERLWNELWQGGWSIAHVSEEDGRRLLVIRRTDPRSQRPLTAREREVLVRALDGMALKNIAADLGTTGATVSTQLNQALTKLGLDGRAQLLAILVNERET